MSTKLKTVNLSSILNEHFLPMTELTEYLAQKEEVRELIAVFKIPSFNDYKSLSLFLQRKETPFSEKKDFISSSFQLHLVIIINWDIIEKSGIVVDEETPEYDWVNSYIEVEEIYDSQGLQIEKGSRRVPLWMTYEWRYLKGESSQYLLDQFEKN